MSQRLSCARCSLRFDECCGQAGGDLVKVAAFGSRRVAAVLLGLFVDSPSAESSRQTPSMLAVPTVTSHVHTTLR